MSDLGMTLIGIPIGLLLIAGMVGSLFLFVHWHRVFRRGRPEGRPLQARYLIPPETWSL